MKEGGISYPLIQFLNTFTWALVDKKITRVFKQHWSESMMLLARMIVASWYVHQMGNVYIESFGLKFALDGGNEGKWKLGSRHLTLLLQEILKHNGAKLLWKLSISPIELLFQDRKMESAEFNTYGCYHISWNQIALCIWKFE